MNPINWLTSILMFTLLTGLRASEDAVVMFQDTELIRGAVQRYKAAHGRVPQTDKELLAGGLKADDLWIAKPTYDPRRNGVRLVYCARGAYLIPDFNGIELVAIGSGTITIKMKNNGGAVLKNMRIFLGSDGTLGFASEDVILDWLQGISSVKPEDLPGESPQPGLDKPIDELPELHDNTPQSAIKPKNGETSDPIADFQPPAIPPTPSPPTLSPRLPLPAKEDK